SILIFLIVSLIAFLDPDGPNADFAEFWNFLERKPGNFNFNASYFFVATTCVVAFSTAVFFHFFLLITNYIRYSRIENYYGYQIIPNDEMLISKKTKNRRNLFIFLILCGLVFYVGYVLYKIIKKKKTATISVK
ncbi:MAG: hypothetical protein LBD05_00510, partial [Mycoplasmataceae bacterium]|nr:hypothetical protein [Mycoplasmataceae bacterium]